MTGSDRPLAELPVERAGDSPEDRACLADAKVPLDAIRQVAGRIGLHTLIPNVDEASLVLPVTESARWETTGTDARW